MYDILTTTDPTSCNVNDGTFTISGLTPNSSYTITYTYNSVAQMVTLTADASGEVVVTGLGAGAYSSISAIEDSTGCSDTLSDVLLDSVELDLSITWTDPTSCNANDGSITLSGATSGLDYTITYTYNSVVEVETLTADASGEIVITGLAAGAYSSISAIEDGTGCSDTLSDVLLDSVELDLSITWTDPTSCNANDGSITLSGATSGLDYTITYTYNSVVEVETLTADASGEIVITGLAAGAYSSLSVIEILTSCIFQVNMIDLMCIENEFACFRFKVFFTPNNDGYNDFWGLELLSVECNYLLYIFDRYGKLLKTLSPQNDRWDGFYGGYNMPSNDYWFLVNYYEDGVSKTYSSHFTLKR